MDQAEAERLIERLRRGYDAFNRGDLESVLDDIDPDVEVEERPDAPDPLHVRGREGAMRGFQALHEEFENYRFEAREFIVEGEHLIVVLRQSGRGRLSGIPIEGDIVHAWRVEDDRVAGLRAFSTLEEAIEAVRVA